MLQLAMFDLQGRPTSHAMRFVVPRSYHVRGVRKNGVKYGYITLNVHKAIKYWLDHPGSHIDTRW